MGIRINVKTWEQLGDSVCLTGAVRNVAAAHPEFEFEYTRFRQYEQVYWNNPDFLRPDPGAVQVGWIGYGDIGAERAVSRGNHVQAMTLTLCERLGISPVPLVTKAPVICLTGEEIEWGRQFNGKWIINANCQRHSISKYYPHWQAVVDGMRGMGIEVVQIGGAEHRDVTTELSGVEDWRGRTDIRHLFAMAHGCAGIVSPSSGIVHIGAAWGRPTVSVVGARENPGLTGLYPRCTALSSDCPYRLCYASVAADCRRFSGGSCACMAEIDPELVLDAVRKAAGDA